MPKKLGKDSTCSIARALEVLEDAWTVLIVREAIVAGTARFQDFRDDLGIATTTLAPRLNRLVDEGIMTRRAYREAGSRPREEYVLTDTGRSLSLVIDALATWGRGNRPIPDGTSPLFSVADDGRAAHLAFVDDDGAPVDPGRVVARRVPDRAFAASDS